MTGPDPAVAAARLAVRRVLPPPPGLVLVACSGGPDSLALAVATAFVAPRAGWRAGAVIVDHGIQAGSDAVAHQAAQRCLDLGLSPVEVVRAEVVPGGGNLEARARQARYQALEQTATRLAAKAILLGHTLDDQAETVLLALGRGSGSTALAGMPAQRGLYRRPFLNLRRSQTAAVCAAAGLQPWHDPMNRPGGPRPSRRAEVRHQLIPVLEDILGPGLVPNLARTAGAIALDNQVLDDLAEQAYRSTAIGPGKTADHTTAIGPGKTADQTAIIGREKYSQLGFGCQGLAVLPDAVRRRVLYRAALAWGADPTALTSTHITGIDALVTAWRGQGACGLPGGVKVRRECGRLVAFSANFGAVAGEVWARPRTQGE